jgi:hypothetical protein
MKSKKASAGPPKSTTEEPSQELGDEELDKAAGGTDPAPGKGP